jgi:predicted lactoylglutathione lyase
MFRPELSGEETACMIVDQNIHVMLVAEDRFRDAADGEIRQVTAAAGFVTGLSAGSAREVDETVAKAIAAGGKPWPIMEERPVHSGSFQDPDGHVWQLTHPRQPDNPRQR